MPACAIVGCSRKYRVGEEVRLFGLPTVITRQCQKTAELSSRRRTVWLSRINRNLDGKQLNGSAIKVCHRHFITGQPSKLFDCTHPDWAPNLHLGYEWKGSEACVSRYLRTQARRRKMCSTMTASRRDSNCPTERADNLPQHLEVQGSAGTAADKATSSSAQHQYFDPEHSVTEEKIVAETSTDLREDVVLLPCYSVEEDMDQATTVEKPIEQVKQQEVESPRVIVGVEWSNKTHIGCQVDLEHQELVGLRRNVKDSANQTNFLESEVAELRSKYSDLLQRNSFLGEQLACMTERVKALTTSMEELKVERDIYCKDNISLREENQKVKMDVKNISLGEESLRGDDNKTKFFTGLPSWEHLQIIYGFVEAGVPYSHRNVLPKFTEFLITLMRLRLGVLEQDLAYRFNVALSTISKICSRWIRAMSARLEKLITWPERSVLQTTIPQYFKEVFGDRFTVIIDCFEVFINRPSSLSPRAETFSRYKHHNTAKFLIGITPQGTVCFVSNAWGGRASDKHITLHSGFLDQLVPGDVVLADRGFDIHEEVGMRRAKIAIPAFTKGKAQLSFDDLQKTREIANIRIHVERMIGFIKRKFRILGCLIPYSYLITPTDDDTPPIDDIIKICCALANTCPSLIRYNVENNVPLNASHPVLDIVFRDDDRGEVGFSEFMEE